MRANQLTHKKIISPQLPDHAQSKRFNDLALTACLGLSLLGAMSFVLVMI